MLSFGYLSMFGSIIIGCVLIKMPCDFQRLWSWLCHCSTYMCVSHRHLFLIKKNIYLDSGIISIYAYIYQKQVPVPVPVGQCGCGVSRSHVLRFWSFNVTWILLKLLHVLIINFSLFWWSDLGFCINNYFFYKCRKTVPFFWTHRQKVTL